MRAAFLFLLIATTVALAVIEGAAYVALHRQDFAWTELDLEDPIGRATAAKLSGLRGEPARCRALLADAGNADRPAPPLRAGSQCGYADGIRLVPESGGSIRFTPAGPVTSCPMAAALALWERDVVQPAAARRFGRPVVRLVHAGSYSCRRLYGRSEGGYSEHATANAFDILGFELAGGETVSVLRDWPGTHAQAAFLRDVRDGACRLFATVLSPDYNAAHADHLHFDQARRGSGGWRMCR
jgi:hypothetical protein